MRVCEQTCTHLHIELQTSRQENIQKVSTAKVIISIVLTTLCVNVWALVLLTHYSQMCLHSHSVRTFLCFMGMKSEKKIIKFQSE